MKNKGIPCIVSASSQFFAPKPINLNVLNPQRYQNVAVDSGTICYCPRVKWTRLRRETLHSKVLLNYFLIGHLLH